MPRSGPLLLVAASGAALFGLAFVPGWIVLDRELRGEGYRHVQTLLDAWTGRAAPVLPLAALTGFLTAILALLGLGWRHPRLTAPALAGSLITLWLVLAAAIPVSQDGHASSVDLSPGWAVAAGAALAAAMVAGSAVGTNPTRRALGAALAVGLVVIIAGGLTRWVGLQVAEGSGAHWKEGSYVRQAAGGEATERLTIGDGRFTIGDRWSGTFESSGWTVVLDEDPACPRSRGTYHAHGEGDDDLRFVKVVDTCRNGARAADLETGIWERAP